MIKKTAQRRQRDNYKIKRIFFHVALLLSTVGLTIVDAAPKYERKNRRDPFIPYVTSDGQLTNIRDEEKSFSLNLEGIIYDKEGQSMAIINGEVLRKNDVTGDAKIIEIRKDSVVYVKDGEIFIIKVRREE